MPRNSQSPPCAFSGLVGFWKQVGAGGSFPCRCAKTGPRG